MIIDLSEWNEYIAEDVSPGSPPAGIELEVTQLVLGDVIFEKKEKDLPGYFKPAKERDPKFPKVRLFWRIKK